MKNKSFIDFLETFNPDIASNKDVISIATELDRIETFDNVSFIDVEKVWSNKGVIIDNFVACYFGSNPNQNILAISGKSYQADKQKEKVVDIMKSDNYKQFFNFSLDKNYTNNSECRYLSIGNSDYYIRFSPCNCGLGAISINIAFFDLTKIPLEKCDNNLINWIESFLLARFHKETKIVFFGTQYTKSVFNDVLNLSK